MAIALLQSQPAAGNLASFALPQPSGVTMVSGQTLRVMSLFWATTNAVTPPTGSTWNVGLAPTTVQNGVLGVYWRIHQAADTTFTWSTTVASHFVLRCLNVNGAHLTTPLDVTPVVSSQATSSTTWSNCPIITPVTADAYVMWLLVAGSVQTSARTLAVGTGWTAATPDAQNASATTGYMGLGAYEARPTPGATGTRTATYSIASLYRGGAVAIRPAAVTGPEAGRNMLLAA